MNTSGDAAEQMVRLTLEGMEVTLRLSGTAAKHVAALLYAVLHNKDRNQMRGRARLVSMMKSGKPLTVFSIRKEELKAFTKEARGYGILYCMLGSMRGNPDGVCDLLIRAEDAPRVNRLVERIQLSGIESGEVPCEEKSGREEEEKSDTEEAKRTEQLLDALFAAPMKEEAEAVENPLQGKAQKDPPSGPSCEKQGNQEEGIFEPSGTGLRPSVRQELKEIQKMRKEEHSKELERTGATARKKETARQRPRKRQIEKVRETDGKFI